MATSCGPPPPLIPSYIASPGSEVEHLRSWLKGWPDTTSSELLRLQSICSGDVVDIVTSTEDKYGEEEGKGDGACGLYWSPSSYGWPTNSAV